MTNRTLLKDRYRDSTGLIVTLGLHAGVAAVVLLAVTTIVPDRPVVPLTVINHVDPVAATPVPLPARPTDLPVTIDIPQPVFDTQTPVSLSENWTTTTTPGEPVVAMPARPADPVTLPVTGITQAARFDPRHSADAQPPYPDAARRLGEQGVVVVHVRIGADGRVLAATLAQSSGSSRLDAAALAQALRKWRFTPALDNGIAVAADRDITINFKLADA